MEDMFEDSPVFISHGPGFVRIHENASTTTFGLSASESAWWLEHSLAFSMGALEDGASTGIDLAWAYPSEGGSAMALADKSNGQPQYQKKPLDARPQK